MSKLEIVYDVHAQSWAHVVADHDHYTHLLAWVREQGFDPHKIYRLEIYNEGKPSAQVFEWAYDEQGNKYCDIDHDHAARANACVIAKRGPYEVILSSLPPGL